MNISNNYLKKFLVESNHIEGIDKFDMDMQMAAAKVFLAVDMLGVAVVAHFVSKVQPDAQLRVSPGMDVRVGEHLPPAGGAEIGMALVEILMVANSTHVCAWDTHMAYENLHPFTDGNGRSGRMIWLWQHRKSDLKLGFLHSFYYQTLARAQHLPEEAKA